MALTPQCYKFGLEYFKGSFITQMNERFISTERFTETAILTGFHLAMQRVGSILIAP